MCTLPSPSPLTNTRSKAAERQNQIKEKKTKGRESMSKHLQEVWSPIMCDAPVAARGGRGRDTARGRWKEEDLLQAGEGKAAEAGEKEADVGTAAGDGLRHVNLRGKSYTCDRTHYTWLVLDLEWSVVVIVTCLLMWYCYEHLHRRGVVSVFGA